jgi:CDP-diacylglycerol--glycerol-3-phosphate 3-phosphatidyltransferase
VVLAAVATAGSVMVSYSRARAESLIPLRASWNARAAGVLIIGGLFNRMGPVLWVIAVISTMWDSQFTAWQETRVFSGQRLSCGVKFPWI